jgi:hypothetical protein
MAITTVSILVGGAVTILIRSVYIYMIIPYIYI